MNGKSQSKIAFIPFYVQCPQHRAAASARFRAEWPAKYLNADVVGCESNPKLLEYDVIIFQKCYNEKFKLLAGYLKSAKPAIRLGLDLCDAEWIRRPDEIQGMIEEVDFLTASTNQIKKWANYHYPVKRCYRIPDGHDLDYYAPDLMTRPEISSAGPMRYVWFGNSGTIQSLKAVLPLLERIRGKDDELTIIADERARGAVLSQRIGVKFVPWSLETANEEIKKGNLALNPRLNTPEYAVKSNNKTATAYILGLPCIDRKVTDEAGWRADLMKMRQPALRLADVQEKRQQIVDKYSMEIVAKIWGKVLAKEIEK